MMQQVVLVTGAGSGIGKLSAQSLALAGHVVYASMRDVDGRSKGRADEVLRWAAERGVSLHPLELDVLSQESADVAAAAIIELDTVLGEIVSRPV